MELLVVIPICNTEHFHGLALTTIDHFNDFSQTAKDLEAFMKTDMRTCSTRLGTLHTRAWRVFTLFASLLLTLALAPGVLAQGITGTITGTVTDATGAIIPGAAVTIRNVDTNASRTVTTSDIGSYTVPQLHPGNYSVKVEKAGFKLYEQSNVTVQMDQVVLINAQLQVGSNGETITVTDAPPSIQTEQSSNGLVLDSNQIESTPLNGRLTLQGLMILSPGVQGMPNAQDQIPTSGVTLSVGSTRRNSYGTLQTTLDGSVNEELVLQRSAGEIPSIDALDQFKIITSGVPAEFGQQAQIIVTTKSGTNSYHGELLEFNRSKGLNAKTNSFVSHTAAAKRPPYERNEYGGNFSGPISIPHLYNGKDRSFFFAAYEGFGYTFSSAANTTQPTALMRTGDFSEFILGGACYTSAKGPVNIVNPVTGTNYATTNGNKIPIADQNTVSLKLLNYLYPNDNPTATGCNAYTTNTFENISYTQNAKRISLRLDHKLTDRDQLRGTFMRAFFGPYTNSWTDSLTGGYGGYGEHNVDTSVGWTHTFSPSMILDAPASYLHLLVVRLPHRTDVNFGSFIPGLGTTQNSGSPAISIANASSNPYGGSITSTGDSGGGHPGLEQDIQFSPTLTKVFAKHTAKTGVAVVYGNYFDTTLVDAGHFAFNQSYSHDSFADFLLGIPASSQNGNPSGEWQRRLRTMQYSAFLQDDWKLRRNLTVNIGIRYDQQWFADDPLHRAVLFVPEQNKAVYFGSAIPSTAVPAYATLLQNDNMLTTSAQANMSSNPYDYVGQPDPKFAPRFGFAYEFRPKTVLRGAYGIYYNLLAAQYANTWWGGQAPFKSSAKYTNSSTAYNGSYFNMSSPYVTSGKYGNATFEIDAQAKTKTPYSETYNLAIERELPAGIDLRIGYAGQHNLKQSNNGQNSYVNLNIGSDPMRVYGSTSADAQAAQKLQSSYRYQPLSSVMVQDYPYYHTSMNSLQVGLHKRYQSGSSVNAEFQWTRILGIESFMDNTGAHPHDSYGPIGNTVPLLLNLNYIYTLPVGRGHLLLNHASNLVDKIVGGWQYSGVGSFQAGQPFSVTANWPSNAVIASNPNGVTNRANRVSGVSLYPAKKTNAQWFNTAAFMAPPCYNSLETSSATLTCDQVVKDGNAAGVSTYTSFGNSGYDMLRGPGWWNLDMNLVKNIKWTNHYNLQLRAESFNTFNHPNYGNPASNISNSSSVGIISSNSNPPYYQSRSVEFGAKFNF
jgi:hypothetical protein